MTTELNKPAPILTAKEIIICTVALALTIGLPQWAGRQFIGLAYRKAFLRHSK